MIRYVDTLDQAKLKSFEWNYRKEELIQDFTGYDYEVKAGMEDYIRWENG